MTDDPTTRTCPDCEGKGVRDDARTLAEWDVPQSCGRCEESGRVPLTTSELFDALAETLRAGEGLSVMAVGGLSRRAVCVGLLVWEGDTVDDALRLALLVRS